MTGLRYKVGKEIIIDLNTVSDDINEAIDELSEIISLIIPDKIMLDKDNFTNFGFYKDIILPHMFIRTKLDNYGLLLDDRDYKIIRRQFGSEVVGNSIIGYRLP